MNKSNSDSIYSIASLDDDNKPIHCNPNDEDSEKEDSITIETVDSDDVEILSEDEIDVNNNHNMDKGKSKPKIQMYNSLAYGLEDPIEGKTYEWMDSKYVRLLQLSTFSSVMGPKVKFVWKNHEIYSVKTLNLQNALNREREQGEKSKSNTKTDEDQEDNKQTESDDMNNNNNNNNSYNNNHRNYTIRSELAYHELEAWIAKQTLDCTSWKNKHSKTSPPPFTKKTMIAPEFGVVLSCIQFDSSLRALRNKSFNQYINGVYAHTPANTNHHNQSQQSGQQGNNNNNNNNNGTPKGGLKFNYKQTAIPNSVIGASIPPTSSPYEHTGLTDDGSPNQFPTSSARSNSSRFSSPSGYQPPGDTLADYLSKFAPFSFAAGMSGGMNISGATVPQVPYASANGNGNGNNNGHPSQQFYPNFEQLNHMQQLHNNGNNNHHIDDNEDPDDIGHYSLVLAIEYKYYEKFIESLDAIEHWLYMIASQIRYLLALNKVFKCDQMENSLKLGTDINALHGDGDILNDSMNNNFNSWDDSMDDGDCPDRLHTIIPFMTNIAPAAVFKFDQLFSATFVSNHHCDSSSSAASSSTTSPLCTHINEDMPSISMSSSYLIQDPRYGMIYNMSYVPSRGLPAKISLFNTWFTSSLDNRDKHKLSTMISSHLQTLGRTIIIGDDEEEIDRYISTLALFSTQQQKSLSRLSVKVDDPSNLTTHYVPELYLQGIVIPQIKPLEINKNHNNNNSPPLNNSPMQPQLNTSNNIFTESDTYQATVSYLQSSSAIKQLREDLYLAPGPSTLVFLTSSKHANNVNNDDEKQSFWMIRQTAMPHKFKQEQQNLLFQKLFYLRRRRRRNSSSYIYARKRSGQYFDSSPSRRGDNTRNINNPYLTPPNINNITNDKLSSSPPTDSAKNKISTAHQRTLARKRQKQMETTMNQNNNYMPKEFKSMINFRTTKKLNENEENNGDINDTDSVLEDNEDMDNDNDNDNDNESVTATSTHSAVTNTTITSNNTHLSSSIPQPIHAPHLHQNDTNKNNLTYVEPLLSPMIATIVFGSFNIPQELKLTFLEVQFRILLEKASEILLYIEHEQKELLSFYDKTCHVMSCKEFKEQVPMEALYPQIMQKFESQLRSDLQITRSEDLHVLLSISEGFRPNLFSLMFGNPVFDIEVADILRYFLF